MTKPRQHKRDINLLVENITSLRRRPKNKLFDVSDCLDISSPTERKRKSRTSFSPDADKKHSRKTATVSNKKASSEKAHQKEGIAAPINVVTATNSSSTRSSRHQQKRNVQKAELDSENELTILKEVDVDSSPEFKKPLPPPAKIKKGEPLEDTASDFSFSSSTNLQESVSTCLTRNKSRLNMSLHQSFVSLGNLKLDTTIAALPEWIAKAHQKRSHAPSQILAKIEYKSPKNVKESTEALDKKIMPPPAVPLQVDTSKEHDSKIRIQKGKENVRELRNWCFKINANKGISIQGYDIAKEANIVSTDITIVKNQRTVTTTRSTYQLVGPIDLTRLKQKLVPVQLEMYFQQGFPENWKEIIMSYSTGTLKYEESTEDEGPGIVFSDSDTNSVKEANWKHKTVEHNACQSRAHSSRKGAAEKSKLQSHTSVPQQKEISKPAAVSHQKVVQAESAHENSVEDPIVSDNFKIPEMTTALSLPNDAKKITIHNWSIEDLKGKFKLVGVEHRQSGKIKHHRSFNLDDWTVNTSRTLLNKKDNKVIELVGPALFHKTSGYPEHIIEKFENGIPVNFSSLLEECSSSTIRRTARVVYPPTKYWQGHKVATIGGKTYVRGSDLDDWKMTSSKVVLTDCQPQPSKETKKSKKNYKIKSKDSESDEDLVKSVTPRATTLKAAKKKADYKAKHKEKATFKTTDFFGNSELDDSFDNQFQESMHSPVRKVKTASKNCLSPMQAFLKGQSANCGSSTDEDEEMEEVRDKRKKKTYEKFVYHETNKISKKQAPITKKVTPSAKVKKSELTYMKEFLEKNKKRKKDFDRRHMFGEDSDDFDE